MSNDQIKQNNSLALIKVKREIDRLAAWAEVERLTGQITIVVNSVNGRLCKAESGTRKVLTE